MPIIRKQLYATEGVSKTQRWNEEEEVFQTSYDGGTTWVDTPASDPRFDPAQITPETGEQCDVAQGMANFVREFVDGTYAAFNVVGISSWAITIGLLFVPPLALFYRIAMLVADGIVSIGSVTLAATFDEELYDDLKCIFFDNLQSDGHFADQAAWENAGEQIQDEIGDGNVNIVMAAMYNLYGYVGFQNGAIRLAEDSNCTACANEYIFDFPVDGQQFWSPVLGTLAQWDSGGSFWKMVCAGGVGSLAQLRIERSLDFDSTFTHVEADVEVLGAGIEEFNVFVRVASVWTLAASFGGASAGVQTLGGDITPISGDGLRVDFADSDGCGSTDLYLNVLRFIFE